MITNSGQTMTDTIMIALQWNLSEVEVLMMTTDMEGTHVTVRTALTHTMTVVTLTTTIVGETHTMTRREDTTIAATPTTANPTEKIWVRIDRTPVLSVTVTTTDFLLEAVSFLLARINVYMCHVNLFNLSILSFPL